MYLTSIINSIKRIFCILGFHNFNNSTIQVSSGDIHNETPIMHAGRVDHYRWIKKCTRKGCNHKEFTYLIPQWARYQDMNKLTWWSRDISKKCPEKHTDNDNTIMLHF